MATFAQDKDAEPNAPLEPPYTLLIGNKNDEGGDVEPIETFNNVSLESDDPQFIESVVNGFSNLVEVELVALSDVPITQVQPPPSSAFLGHQQKRRDRSLGS